MTPPGDVGARPVTVMVATPLEPELTRVIGDVDPRIEVLYAPELLPPARYPSDHRGSADFRRDAAGEQRFREMLERAEVLFGVPGDSPEGLADVVRGAPAVRWVQATSAGAGQQVHAAGLTAGERQRVTVTTAAGVHARPLAEFALLGLLAFVKDLPRLQRDQAARRWDHYPMRELGGGTVLVLGLGGVGREVARMAHCLGMRVLATRRRPGTPPAGVDELHPPQYLKDLVPRADAVVVTLPLTSETRGMVDRETIALMRPHATVVNVGRGAVIDEAALIEALRAERIGGAALDVFTHEPLPPESPLWELPNVLLAPHTAALSHAENERIVELFADNLRRYLDGRQLHNVVDPELFY